MPVQTEVRPGRKTKCGWCLTDNHDRCRIVTRNGMSPTSRLAFCACNEEACVTKQESPPCVDCRHHSQQDIDPVRVVCLDQEACLARRTARLDSDPFVQQIAQHRENAKMAETETKTERKAAVPKVGKCIVTGAETKGGKFAPGMDARYVSNQVAAVLDKSKTETQVRREMEGHGLSDALKAKFDKALGLARAKAAKAIEAEKAKAKEKADAKATKAADKAAAKATATAEAEDGPAPKTDEA